MSGFQGHDRDLSRYNHMSTEELEAILRADFELPEEEESDMEKILYITEVIARRRAGQPTGRYADADGAWKSFVENYLPEENQAAFCPDENPGKEDEVNTKKPKPRFLKTVLLRVASVALAIALVAAAGTLTASAFGFDFWAWFTAWTQEVFGVQKPNFVPFDQEIPEQLSELYAAMKEYGFPDHLLPTYLPEGYEAGEVECQTHSGYVTLCCLLEKDNASILFDYTLHLTEQATVGTQKDDDDPDVREAGGVTHYIMTNDDTYYAVWTVDNVACLIHGIASYAEMTKMIDSIYGGQS